MKKQPVKQEQSGVGATLEWLKQRELNGRLAVEQCEASIARLRNERDKNNPKHDGRDWEKEMRGLQADLDYCEEQSSKLRNDLLKFELKVVPEKREAGESITQGEGSQLIEMAVTHLRLGFEQIKIVASQNLPLCKTEVDALEMLSPLLNTCFTSAMQAAVDNAQLPKWTADAVKNGL